MHDLITVSKEDYLKAILESESEGKTVIPALLAHWLSVSAPAVTMAVKRLKRDGYVEVKADGILRLTPKGRETATHTALRHHLVERMLTEIFGMEWYEIHNEAEHLEHAVSPAFEAKLIERLGDKGLCPHGNTVLPETPTQRQTRPHPSPTPRRRLRIQRSQLLRARPQTAGIPASARLCSRRTRQSFEKELRPDALHRNPRRSHHPRPDGRRKNLGQTPHCADRSVPPTPTTPKLSS